MSFSQEDISITVHNTTPTTTRVINVPTGLHIDDMRHRIYRQATHDLGEDALPEISSIVLLSRSPKDFEEIPNNSVQEFAHGSAMHAIVSITPNLDLNQEAQNHPSYWPLMIAFLRGELDDVVEQHRQDREKEVNDIIQILEGLAVEAETHKTEMAALEQQVNEMKQR